MTIRMGGRLVTEEVARSVVDGGPVSGQNLAAIFWSFFQSGLNNMKRALGNGLDLYVAYRLAVAHGGRLWAENMTPLGMTFHCAFPLNTRASTPLKLAHPVPRPRAKSPVKTRSRRSSMRVLVLEADLPLAQY